MPLFRKLTRAWHLWQRSGGAYWRMAQLQPPYSIAWEGRRVAVVPDAARGTADAYREIVAEDCYGIFRDASQHVEHRCIVDVGANVGIFSMACSILFPASEIVSYEPYPEAYTALEQNAQKSKNIKIYSECVGAGTGTGRMEIMADSRVARIGEHGDLEVQMIGGNDILTGREIDLLKMDCEGAEWDILAHSDLFERSKNVRMEYHLLHQEKREDFIRLLEGKGHEIISHWPGDWTGILWSRRI